MESERLSVSFARPCIGLAAHAESFLKPPFSTNTSSSVIIQCLAHDEDEKGLSWPHVSVGGKGRILFPENIPAELLQDAYKAVGCGEQVHLELADDVANVASPSSHMDFDVSLKRSCNKEHGNYKKPCCCRSRRNVEAVIKSQNLKIQNDEEKMGSTVDNSLSDAGPNMTFCRNLMSPDNAQALTLGVITAISHIRYKEDGVAFDEEVGTRPFSVPCDIFMEAVNTMQSTNTLTLKKALGSSYTSITQMNRL